jgi:hypothetical protein
MKNKPIEIKLIRKVANVYVLLFPKLNISLTVNEYYYQKMLQNSDEYEFTNLKANLAS